MVDVKPMLSSIRNTVKRAKNEHQFQASLKDGDMKYKVSLKALSFHLVAENSKY